MINHKNITESKIFSQFVNSFSPFCSRSTMPSWLVSAVLCLNVYWTYKSIQTMHSSCAQHRMERGLTFSVVFGGAQENWLLKYSDLLHEWFLHQNKGRAAVEGYQTSIRCFGLWCVPKLCQKVIFFKLVFCKGSNQVLIVRVDDKLPRQSASFLLNITSP